MDTEERDPGRGDSAAQRLARRFVSILGDYMEPEMAEHTANNAASCVTDELSPEEAIERTLRHNLRQRGRVGFEFPPLDDWEIRDIAKAVADDPECAALGAEIEKLWADLRSHWPEVDTPVDRGQNRS